MVATLLLLCLAGLSPVLADIARQFVRPGETVLLAQGKEEIVAGPGQSSSALHFLKEVDKEWWAVTYTAPNPPTVSEEAVTFVKGGQSQTIVVSIAAYPNPDDPSVVGKAARVVFGMLVVAVILEAAFHVVFNWRVFLEFFDGRGVRTVLMFAGAYLVVDGFNQDYVASLFQIYMGGGETTERQSNWGTKILTALVLAGGSASVNSLMVALKLRENRTAEQVTPKPPPTKAWIAVKVHMKQADEIVQIQQLVVTPAPAGAEQLLGVIHPTGFWRRIGKYFWRDTRRLPTSAGLVVDPNVQYTIIVHGRTKPVPPSPANPAGTPGRSIYCDAAGTPLTQTPAGGFVPTPSAYVFAPGAIVDFEVTL